MATVSGGVVPIEERPPIRPRRMRFAFDELQERYFYDNNSLITAFMAALSGMFPPGEDEFVASVRSYLDQVDDPELRARVKGFVGQEAHHADQHQRANRAIDQLGLQATRIEEMLREHIATEIKKVSSAQRLASTVAMEHITAVLAHYMLTHPETLEPFPDAVQELLQWHAVEEIEHKSVAFDVYEQCVGDRKLLRIVFTYSVIDFVYHTMKYQASLLRWAGKVPAPREVVGAARFFFGRKGMITKSIRPLLQFLREDFHPWDVDDRRLIEPWISRHARPRAVKAA